MMRTGIWFDPHRCAYNVSYCWHLQMCNMEAYSWSDTRACFFESSGQINKLRIPTTVPFLPPTGEWMCTCQHYMRKRQCQLCHLDLRQQREICVQKIFPVLEVAHAESENDWTSFFTESCWNSYDLASWVRTESSPSSLLCPVLS